MKKNCLMLVIVVLLALLLCIPAAAADDVATVDGVGYDDLAAAIAAANLKTGAVVNVVSDCSINGTVELLSPMTLKSENGSEVTLTGSAEQYGFRIGKGKSGEYRFEGLTISTKVSLSCISIQAYAAENRAAVSVKNCTLNNFAKTGIDFEGTYTPRPTDYFDLTVEDCDINAVGYGIGSALDNCYTLVPESTIRVTGTRFNSDGTTGIYAIHAPSPLKSLYVADSSAARQTLGGIKYVFSPINRESVIIKNNDFSDCNIDNSPSCYTLLVFNRNVDITDKYSYCYATELTGNDLRGQNVIILAYADNEVIWFPDGQAKNSVGLNNLGGVNITDAGTRYSMYMKQHGNLTDASLTDFNIEAAELHFLPAGQPQTTEFLFNTASGSGFYSNCRTGTASSNTDCWTQENPRHVGAHLTSYDEALAITRFFLDGVALEADEADPQLLVGENDVARVEVDKAAGVISVTPLALGNAVLTATVGAGPEGELLNAKSDTLKIAVEVLYPVTYHSNYPAETGKPDADFDGGEYAPGTKYTVVSASDAAFDAGEDSKLLGWATSVSDADKSVVSYKVGDELEIPAGDTHLYAVWAATLGEEKVPATGDAIFPAAAGSVSLVSIALAVLLSFRRKENN